MERGKLICNTLKEIRKKIADANGIEYIPVKCDHQGDCMGTCPMCEAEVQYLEQELEKKKLAKESVNIIGVAEFDRDRFSDNMLCLDSMDFENKRKEPLKVLLKELLGRLEVERMPMQQGKLVNKEKLVSKKNGFNICLID